MMGVTIINQVSFQDLNHPSDSDKCWNEKYSPDDLDLNEYCFDMIIVLSCIENIPQEGFDHQAMNTMLSIAVTGNFANNKTTEEQPVEEISGLSIL